jgi:hypothetical protein
VGKDKEAA